MSTEQATRMQHVVRRNETKLLRESFVLFDARGAIEAWRMEASYGYDDLGRYLGGVEVHKTNPEYDGQPTTRCEWAESGECYHDGSSTAYENEAQYYFHNMASMRSYLTDWFEREIGKVREAVVSA